jgi:lysine-N-methylase
MEELDDEWVNTKREFAALFSEETYAKLVKSYLSSPDYSELGYEHLLVYFVSRYMMNAAADFDILTYGKLVIVSTLVVRDMDVARFCRNKGSFTMFDRIDVARIYSKEVEHSEGNADDLKEMCMMDEIAHADALYRQI